MEGVALRVKVYRGTENKCFRIVQNVRNVQGQTHTMERMDEKWEMML